MSLTIGVIAHKDTHIVELSDIYNAIQKFHPVAIYNFKDAVHPHYEIYDKFKGANKLFFHFKPFDLCNVQDQIDIDSNEPLPDMVLYWTGEKPSDRVIEFLGVVVEGLETEGYEDIIEQLAVPETRAVAERKFYDYEQRLDVETGWVYCQVTRPDGEAPYTVVIKSFKEDGLEPLFAHLFYSSSWGLMKNDYIFLKHLWEHLGMEGEYDHDQLMKKYTERCYPSETRMPDEEPTIYRKSITDILDKEFVNK